GANLIGSLAEAVGDGAQILQRRIKALVDMLERIGGADDRLTLMIDAIGHARYLVEQVFRHVLQKIGLAGEALNSLHRLAGEVPTCAAHLRGPRAHRFILVLLLASPR